MYAKFKTNLIGLAFALGLLVVGYGLGEPPRAAPQVSIPESLLADAEIAPIDGDKTAPPSPGNRGALKRQLSMPYVSFPALLPRQES